VLQQTPAGQTNSSAFDQKNIWIFKKSSGLVFNGKKFMLILLLIRLPTANQGNNHPRFCSLFG
jgi:hypothetical protein